MIFCTAAHLAAVHALIVDGGTLGRCAFFFLAKLVQFLILFNFWECFCRELLGKVL